MRRIAVALLVAACTRPEAPPPRGVDGGRPAAAPAADAHEVCGPDDKARADVDRAKREEQAQREAEAEAKRAQAALEEVVKQGAEAGTIPSGRELDAAIARFTAARKLAGADLSDDVVRAAVVDSVTARQSCRAVAADDAARCDTLAADEKARARCRGKVARLRGLSSMIREGACDARSAERAVAAYGKDGAAAPLVATCRAVRDRSEQPCGEIQEPHAAATCRALGSGDVARCDALPEERRANCRADVATLAAAAMLVVAPRVELAPDDWAMIRAARGDESGCASAGVFAVAAGDQR